MSGTKERLRIREARLAYKMKHNRRIEVAEIVAHVFTDADTIDLSDARKHQIISRWNHGHNMKMATAHRVQRLAQVLETTMDDLIDTN